MVNYGDDFLLALSSHIAMDSPTLLKQTENARGHWHWQEHRKIGCSSRYVIV